MGPRAAWIVAAVLVLAAAPALAQDGNNSTGTSAAEKAADPPYRKTGEYILYGTFVAIVAGVIASWWVVRRYEP